MQLGQYKVVETLGRGGFGIVYKAQAETEDGGTRWVALKVLTLGEEVPVDGQARLRDEARLLQRLSHEAIVEVEEVVCLEGRWTLVMEYLDGANLTEIVGQGPVPISVALNIVAKVADALFYAFNLVGDDGTVFSMVHRDIKPSNVLVTKDGSVKVLDFGVARANFSERESDTGVHVLGSMHYLAPERFEGVSGAASDIYALGVVLFEILVGERMGRCSSDARRHDAFLQSVRQRLMDALAGSGTGVAEIVVQMLAHSSSLRPMANEVRDRCQKLLRYVEPLDFEDWANSVAGGLSKARSQSAPHSPDWPETVGRSQWAGRFEATDSILWSTTDNTALGADQDQDTLSLVFAEKRLYEQRAKTDPNMGDFEDLTDTFVGPHSDDFDSQDITVPDIDSVLRRDSENRDGQLLDRSQDIASNQIQKTNRSFMSRYLVLMIWLVIATLLSTMGLLSAMYVFWTGTWGF